jgi:hypothetical protein
MSKELECKHEPLIDTGVGYYHCPACNNSWEYDEYKDFGVITDVEQLSEFDFFIINLREHTSIAINVVEDKQFIGIAFYKTNLGWSFNPTKIGRGYLSNCKEDFDYTNNFQVAKDNADQTK